MHQPHLLRLVLFNYQITTTPHEIFITDLLFRFVFL